jgi:hypothetical protein
MVLEQDYAALARKNQELRAEIKRLHDAWRQANEWYQNRSTIEAFNVLHYAFTGRPSEWKSLDDTANGR